MIFCACLCLCLSFSCVCQTKTTYTKFILFLSPSADLHSFWHGAWWWWMYVCRCECMWMCICLCLCLLACFVMWWLLMRPITTIIAWPPSRSPFHLYFKWMEEKKEESRKKSQIRAVHPWRGQQNGYAHSSTHNIPTSKHGRTLSTLDTHIHKVPSHTLKHAHTHTHILTPTFTQTHTH